MRRTPEHVRARRLVLQDIIQKTDHELYPLGINKTINIELPRQVDRPLPKLTETVLRCKKVPINFSSIQLPIVTKLFEIYRLTYNEALREYKLREHHWRKQLNSTDLRDKIKPIIIEKCKYLMIEIPIRIIDEAVFDVCKAYKTAYSNVLAKNITHFQIRYKKKCDTICIAKKCFAKNNNTFMSELMGDFIDTGSFDINDMAHACRLSKRYGSFILFVPCDVPVITTTVEKTCALDPGVRTFQSLYDKESLIEIGGDLDRRIRPIIKRLNEKGKYNKRFAKRLRAKISHIVEDVQYKACQYLTTNYNVVMIGNMSTQSVMQGNLNGLTKQVLQAMSHYTFRQRLIAKGELNGCTVKIIDEAYTSKTCSFCGFIKDDLGSNKVYNCNSCSRIMDRDSNAARNIFIKGATIGE